MKTNNLFWALACFLLLNAVPQQELSASAGATHGALAAVMSVVDRWQPVLDGVFGALAVAQEPGAAMRALDALHGYGLALHGEAAALRLAWPELRRIYALPGLAPFFSRIAPHVGRYTAILGQTEKRFAGHQGVQAALGRVRRLAGR